MECKIKVGGYMYATKGWYLEQGGHPPSTFQKTIIKGPWKDVQ